MTVFDSSAVIDLLLGVDAAQEVQALLEADAEGAAPDLLTFEVLAVLRRAVLRGELSEGRAHCAVQDLADVSLELFGTLALRERAWELRENLTAADALYVALAEALSEPLVTKDRRLAAAARSLTGVEVVAL